MYVSQDTTAARSGDGVNCCNYILNEMNCFLMAYFIFCYLQFPVFFLVALEDTAALLDPSALLTLVSAVTLNSLISVVGPTAAM